MPQSPFSTPRLLLNRLRQMMAEAGDTGERLDRIVKLIAGNMVADVCSVYVRTPDGALELAATEGLRREAIRATRLKADEGLVGQIAMSAEPLAIQDAPRHPAFSYRPETGEDPYHAFMGVPLLRGGRVIGVLTVQNRTERNYGEEEVEALETVAMVLAEMIATQANAEAQADGQPGAGRQGRADSVKGRVLCEGLAIGWAQLHDPIVPAARFFAEDRDAEAVRLNEGLVALRLSVDRMLSIDVASLGGDPREIMETYRLLAHDPSWAEKLHEGVRGGLTAEASVDRARREHRARLETARDPYLRDRLHDLEDLDNRILRILGGNSMGLAGVGPGSILVARRLGPAELLEYHGTGLAAVLLEESAISSHAAIVARALGIPTIGGLEGVTTLLEAGDRIIVDAETGTIHIRPDDGLEASYQARLALRGERQAEYRALRALPARTRDGIDVVLMLNAGLELDLEHLDATGADGIGLFRTEFQFLVSETLPRITEQQALYERVLDGAGERPVIFRTVDLGGDKMLPSLNRAREENPALGWRSIRFALDTPGFFRRQLRALVRACHGRPLSVMFPMVTTPEEFHRARAMLMAEIDWSTARGHPAPSVLKVGLMLETPSIAYALDAVAGQADFVSIGTNDLMQFFFAADRMSERVSTRYDVLSHAPMRFLHHVAEECARLGITTSVCGEITGSPLEALCLITLGYHRLSMPVGGLGPVKRLVRSLELEPFRHDFLALLGTSNGSFRNEVLALARLHGAQLNDG